VKLKAQKDKPIKMRFAESLQKDGSLYMANLRGAEVTNIYTPSKDGEFSWCPTFTYQGFRYAEISGIDYMPQTTDFTGMVNYDEMKTIGSFETSNSLLNQIYKNAYWGIRGNYRSFPTDCPQRDERMPWLGDRATGCYGESFIFDNGLLYEKWLQDIEDSQRESGSLSDVAPNYWQFYHDNITWPAVYMHVANMIYEKRGDSLPIVKYYPSMKKWLDYMKTYYMKNYLIERDIYGDWCMPPESLDLIHSKDPNRKTDGALLATSFYYRLVNIMAKFADISGNKADIAMYNELAEQIKKAYNDKFLNKENGYYGNNTVTANLVSLMQDLVPESHEQKVVDNIVNKTEGEFNSHVGVGLIGIQFLMRGLTTHGQGDLAYKIATNKTYPSWGYMIENDATTIWELWNGNTADPAMNSGNHVMLLGDLLSWYYENLAGIKTDKFEVGFKKIIMKPIFFEGLNYVKATTESPYGKIASAWNKTQTGLEWTVEIPANSSAELYFSSSSLGKITNNNRIISGNKNMQLIDNLNGIIRLQVASGKYNFKIEK
jgi:alpha-L-rhamnosidase